MSFYLEKYECAVLGEMMMRGKFFEEVVEEDFDNSQHRSLFRAIKRRHETGKPFSVVDLKGEGISIFGGNNVGLMVSDAMDYFTPVVTIRELKKATNRRAIAKVISDAAAEIRDGSEVDEIINKIEGGLLEVSKMGDLRNSQRAEDLVGVAIGDIEQIYQRKGELSGIPTGMPGINRLTDGFQNSDYIIIAARPSMGKTAVALHFMLTACRSGKKVGFFSAEMPAKKIMQRMICSIAGISLQQIRSGMMTSSQFHSLAQAAEEISGFDLYIDDTPNIDITRLSIEAKQMKRKHKIDMLVVDYLGLLDSKKSDEKSIYEKVTGISRKLKQLSRELDIPVIVLAQINRDAEGREPTMSNLRDSGAIEQDADTIMMLHKRGEHEDSAMDLIVAKHRNGPTGRVGIMFDRELQRFAEFKEP
jgi:replicative DNA helicase